MNKRGQELSTNAIIMIVIGVIVLVVLVLGFTLGWNKVLPFFSSNNVQDIQTGCNTACSTNNAYDFCSFNRTLKSNDLPGGVGQVYGNCTFFSNRTSSPAFVKYGITPCPSIDCTTLQ